LPGLAAGDYLLKEVSVVFRKTTPILRIFDEDKAKEFYIDYLGFKSA